MKRIEAKLKIRAGGVIAEGKTKRVLEVIGKPELVILRAKDDITAGNGAKRASWPGKAIQANETTCNVFGLLKACGIPLAFIKKISDTELLSLRGEMLQYEVVVRRIAKGSILKREPSLADGQILNNLRVEFFLKTTGGLCQGIPLSEKLPVDDPIIVFKNGKAYLFRPDMPIGGQEPLRILDEFPLCDDPDKIKDISKIALQVFLILEKAWQLAGYDLADMKMEFCIGPDGQLLLADVIDNDSWRVLTKNGDNIDKQKFRDGEDIKVVARLYQLVAEITRQFAIPRQRIIIWLRAPIAEDSKVIEEFSRFANCFDLVILGDCSILGQHLQKKITEYPETVIVVIGGNEDGAARLERRMCLPVFFSERSSDFVATLDTLRILAMRNPCLYSMISLSNQRCE